VICIERLGFRDEIIIRSHLVHDPREEKRRQRSTVPPDASPHGGPLFASVRGLTTRDARWKQLRGQGVVSHKQGAYRRYIEG
jgi:hypothetical protein